MGGPTGEALRQAANAAFMDGFGLAMLAGAVLLAAGAVAVLWRLPSHDLPAQPGEALSHPQRAGRSRLSPDEATREQRPPQDPGPQAPTAVWPVGSAKASADKAR